MTTQNRFAPDHLRQKTLLLRDSKLMMNAMEISNSKYHCFPIDAEVTHKDNTNSHFQFRVENLVKDFGGKTILLRDMQEFSCLHSALGKVSSHSGLPPGNI